jgi:glycerophosphoryl diester phosphodiesterase
VIHDESVDRTTDGRGRVAALPLSRLRRLDAGSWFSPAFRGERIPTLEETLDCARGRCGLNLEIKVPSPGRRHSGRGASTSRSAGPLSDAVGWAEGPAGALKWIPRLVKAMAGALRRSRFGGPLIVSSFSIPALVSARVALPRVRLGLLASRPGSGLASIHRKVGLYSVHPHVRLAARPRFASAHALGLRVFVWPVNDATLLRRLLRLGADGLMTDDPALFEELRASGATRRRADRR